MCEVVSKTLLFLKKHCFPHTKKHCFSPCALFYPIVLKRKLITACRCDKPTDKILMILLVVSE